MIYHDELNRALRDAASQVEPDAIGSALVAALRSRRLTHWSSLASFALASALPEHDFLPLAERRQCGICGAYERLDAFDSDQFARIRNGGTARIDSLRYALYDLACFAGETHEQPDALDREFFDAAILRIASQPADSRTFAAEKALGVLISSRIERKLFLGILGVCGVMASPTRPGLWPTFVDYRDRARLDASPYTYPVAWWRGRFGINAAALAAFGLEAFLSERTLRRLADAAVV